MDDYFCGRGFPFELVLFYSYGNLSMVSFKKSSHLYSYSGSLITRIYQIVNKRVKWITIKQEYSVRRLQNFMLKAYINTTVNLFRVRIKILKSVYRNRQSQCFLIFGCSKKAFDKVNRIHYEIPRLPTVFNKCDCTSKLQLQKIKVNMGKLEDNGVKQGCIISPKRSF